MIEEIVAVRGPRFCIHYPGAIDVYFPTNPGQHLRRWPHASYGKLYPEGYWCVAFRETCFPAERPHKNICSSDLMRLLALTLRSPAFDDIPTVEILDAIFCKGVTP